MDRAADFKRLARLANGLFSQPRYIAMRWVTLNFGQTRAKITLDFKILAT